MSQESPLVSNFPVQTTGHPQWFTAECDGCHPSSQHHPILQSRPLHIITSSLLYPVMDVTVVPSMMALSAVDHCGVILSAQWSTVWLGICHSSICILLFEVKHSTSILHEQSIVHCDGHHSQFPASSHSQSQTTVNSSGAHSGQLVVLTHMSQQFPLASYHPKQTTACLTSLLYSVTDMTVVPNTIPLSAVDYSEIILSIQWSTGCLGTCHSNSQDYPAQGSRPLGNHLELSVAHCIHVAVVSHGILPSIVDHYTFILHHQQFTVHYDG